MTASHPRILFCLATTALSGGVKVVFEIASRLQARGYPVEILACAGPPRWRDLDVPLLGERDLESIDPSRYDLVVATNAFMVPLLWSRVAPSRLVFYAQDYESFHHAPGATYRAFMAESPALRAVYELPVPIVTQSRAVQRLIRERAGRDAWYAPLGLDRAIFHEQPRSEHGGPHRVLFVGNYLMPYKGMRDGFEAVAALSYDLDVEVVLATQETRERDLFSTYPFATEVHLRPPEPEMPAIYASCDVYCCASWYEGLGLPALEAFACGVPVVSTRTFGVEDYGIDGTNLLLAESHNPADLAAQLRRVLTEPALARRLRDGGLDTVRRGYAWEDGIDHFERALSEIARAPAPPIPSESVLDDMVARLEQEGCFTPLHVFRLYDRVQNDLGAAVAVLAAGRDTAALTTVREIRDGIAPLIANPKAQYYRPFRAQYDLCQLILGLDDEPRLAALLTKRRARRNADAPNPAPALREIRYLD